MTDERYVDPNSGAAPQPGSFAGAEAAEKGFGPPPLEADGTGALEQEPEPARYEAPGEQEAAESVSDGYPALSDEAAQADIDAAADGESVEEGGAEPLPPELVPGGEPGAEATGSEHAEIEHQATSAGLSEGVEPTDPDGTHPSVLPVEDGPSAAEESGDTEAPAEVDEDAADTEVKDYDDVLSGTVPEVVQYMEDHPDEKEAVQAAEAAGQGRVGVANA